MVRISAKRLALSCLACAALVGVAELALRTGAPSRYGTKQPLVWDLGDGPTGAAMNELSRGLWKPKAGATDPWGETIGPDGCRGPSPSHEPGRMQVLALGDSSTYGYGLPESQAWPRLLEAALRARGLPVDVVNGGVIGYTVVQGRVRHEELSASAEPKVVLLAFGAFNDHLAAPAGIGDRRRVELWSQRNAWANRLRRESAVVQLAADLFMARESHQASDPALQQRRDLWGEIDYRGERRVSPQAFASELATLCAEVRSAGGVPVLLSMPRRADLEERKPVLASYTRAVERTASEQLVPLVDARAELASWEPEAAFLAKDWVHPSPAGHARIAELALAVVASELEHR